MLAPSRIGDPASARAFARPYRGSPHRCGVAAARPGQPRPEPGLYLHEYTASGITVRGLVGALDLSRARRPATRSRCCPHEGVHPAQAEELASRMAEMQ